MRLTTGNNKWGGKLPPQKLPDSKKTKEWGEAHLDWAESKTFYNCSSVMNSTLHKKINFDLLNGKVHMEDIEEVLNPEGIKEKNADTEPIPHYPIMNSKIGVLLGEESKRPFDWRVIVTNPTSVSEKEEQKKALILERLQAMLANTAQSQEDYEAALQKTAYYFAFDYQDMREKRANELLKHYILEYNIPLLFNDGFLNALAVNEEIYHFDIVGGEPTIELVDPLKIRAFKAGYSKKIEDASIIIIEDYWPKERVYDYYYDALTKKDIDYLENGPESDTAADGENAIEDATEGFVNRLMIDDTFESGEDMYWNPFGAGDFDTLLPFDMEGNIRVIRMYWKSRRKIKLVKSFDPETGEEQFDFYDDSYIINESLGETEKDFWVNEAWEGTKIGDKIYVNIRPRPVQYNRINNPSRCHLGFVGSIYAVGNQKPYSLVDMMKQFNYQYDVIHDRLNKLIYRNWGTLVRLDFAKIPEDWDIDKWFFYAKHLGLSVEDSFNEGKYGAATGKIAGGLNNASTGVISADTIGNTIQQYINFLEFLKMEMSEVAGITKQREGQISNRETVGGVERATLQSSHITERWFVIHEDVKKRALECLLETAKISLKGRNKKFPYILSDGSELIMTIDGDEFSECDYGLVVDNSNNTIEFNQKLDAIAQAAMQNQAISFSTIMKLYSTASLAEKQRLVENDEREIIERNQQAQQQQLEVQQQEIQAKAQQEELKRQHEDAMNARDNETKILIATIQANSKEDDGIQEPVYSQEAKDKLMESMRQFDKKLALEKEKLNFEKEKAKEDNQIKKEALRKRGSSSAK